MDTLPRPSPALHGRALSRGLHSTTRSIKSGKTFFIVAASLDKVPRPQGFDKPLGHPLEIVPVASPAAPMGPGQPIKVQVLYQGNL